MTDPAVPPSSPPAKGGEALQPAPRGVCRRLRSAARALRGEIAYYRRLLAHPRTPWLAKVLLGLAVAYALSPVDLIPDFIPVLGHLDDLLIVPALVWLAVKFIPPAVRAEAKGGAAVVSARSGP